MTIPDRLKKIRESMAKSQREMSIVIGGSKATWQVYEDGTSVPGGKALEALARQGFNVNWILTGEGTMRREAANEPLDEELLQAVLEAVEQSLSETGLELRPNKKAQLIKALYEMVSEEEDRKVDKATVIRLFKLAA